MLLNRSLFRKTTVSQYFCHPHSYDVALFSSTVATVLLTCEEWPQWWNLREGQILWTTSCSFRKRSWGLLLLVLNYHTHLKMKNVLTLWNNCKTNQLLYSLIKQRISANVIWLWFIWSLQSDNDFILDVKDYKTWRSLHRSGPTTSTCK